MVQRDLIRNAERIIGALAQCSALLDGYDDMPACTDNIRQSVSLLSSISGYGTQFETLEEQLRDVYYTLEDIAMQIHVQAEKMEFDPATAEYVENRLDEIKALKRKYGSSIEDVLRYMDDAQKEIDQLSKQEKDNSQLDQQFAKLSKELVLGCQLGVIQVGGIRQCQGVIVLAENGNKNCVHHQAQDDDCGDNRRLILAETVECIPEERNLLGLKLLVMNLRINADKFKLFSGNFRHLIILSHFLDPILILGSMKP